MSNPKLKSVVEIKGPRTAKQYQFRDIAIGSFFYIVGANKDQRLSQKVARYRDEDPVLNQKLIRRSVVITGELIVLKPDCLVELVNLSIEIQPQPEDADKWREWLLYLNG